MATITETLAVAELARAGIAPKVLEPNRHYIITTPNGVTEIDTNAPGPGRKTGGYSVTTAESFAAYVTRHGTMWTEVWANEAARTITGVLNAHAPEAEDFEHAAGWGDHRVTLTLRATPEWAAWTALDRKMLGQVDFSEHVEERLPDFVTPTGADMLELAQHFNAHRAVQFDSSQRLKTGETTLRYQETHQAQAGKKGDIAIPDLFVLALRPFDGAPVYKITARLRYRIDGGTLRLGYLLERPEDVLRTAFADVRGEIAGGIEPTIWDGQPPA